MTTVNNILEGKTGNYFKLEDFGDDPFQIVESFDPAKTEIREEKVPNKNKKPGEKDDITYYHILVRLGDIEKDISLTFTMLKQFAQVMPRNENWRGYKVKYTGSKGTGKNIKYNFVPVGKETVEQSRLDTSPAPEDVTTRVLKSLAMAPHGLQDAPFWADVCKIIPNLGEASELVNRLKTEGRIIQVNGTWKVK